MLSIIIPALNAEDTIQVQLEALANEAPDMKWEILIADNGSSDRTREVIADFTSRCPIARTIQIPEAANASQVRNTAAMHARGTLLAFLDADDVIAPGWVAAVGKALAEHPLVCGQKEYDKLNPRWLVKSRSQTQREGLSSLFGLPVISIGNSGCQRWVWEALGGLDGGLAAGEDNDFSIRAIRELNVEPRFVPEAVLHYRLRRRPADIFKQARAYGRAEPRLYKTYGRESDLRRVRIALRAYLKLVALLFLVPFGRQYRARIAWVLGKRVGRLEGSLRQRVFYL